ncbi:MAG: ATP-binding protein [Nitrososphaeria archaeon]
MKLDWRSYLEGMPIGKGIVRSLEATIYKVPYPEIIASYALLPNKYCTVVPILLIHGRTGTGKSTLMDFIARLRDKRILSATNTTFTAMRNYVHKNQGDQGNCLLLDNLSQRFFDKEYIYNFILTGYDRKTATVAIANRGTSETKEFNTFSPKVISTVFSVHIEPKLSELKRRVIIIKTVKVTNPEIQDISLNNLNDCFK